MPERVAGIRDRLTAENLDSLGGRYQLITKLGTGGMCEVFLASARGLGSFHKLVVIKRMLSSTTKVQGSERMFMDEAEITARFNHPNIVQTYEIVSDAEHLSIVMEFLEGQPLDRIFDLLDSDVLDRDEPSRSLLADRNVWVRIIADALKGLHYAHELSDYDGQPLNIVHRDISPQNLFLTYDGVVKLVDFGIAKAAVSSISTEVGTIKGKIAYMAPEQAMCAPVDRRTDIFSTGVVLWEFIAGKCMRDGDTLGELQKIVSDVNAVPALSTVVKDVPLALEAIVAKATAHNPDDRYASAREMRLALEEYLAGQERTLSTADVGHAISQHFAHDRRILRERIRDSVSGTPPGGASQRETLAPAAASSLGTTAGTSGSVTGGGTLQEMQKSSRRRKVIAAAGVCAVALLAVAALWLVPKNPMPTSTADAPAEADIHQGAVSKADSTEASSTLEEKGAAEATSTAEEKNTAEANSADTAKPSLPSGPVPAAKAPPDPASSPPSESGGQAKPKQRAQWRPPKAQPVPKAQPAPVQPNIQIIDESSEAKVKVDVIE